MTTAISNKEQVEKCRRYIIVDTSRSDKDKLIQDAIITASREIADLGRAEPLHWLKESYDEMFTRFYAQVSEITAADPGVITAESVDPDLSDAHGFSTGDIGYLEGVNGSNSLHRLNQRLFRVVSTADATLTLKTLDGQTDINTTSYEEYSSGGILYHAGVVLPRTTIEPSGGTADYEWGIKRVYGAMFDGIPADPITHEKALKIGACAPGGQPRFFRYQQYAYAGFSTVEHILMWYPFVSQRFNVRALIEKDYPDISTFNGSTYPPHPPMVHDFIWHRALANLATHAEKQRRRTAGKDDGGDNTKMEILNANFWISKAAADEVNIIDYSDKLSGNQAYISEGMSA